LARGCHSLIRQGAKLVEGVGDVLEELAPLLGPSARVRIGVGDESETTAREAGLDAEYQLLLDCLGHDPVAPDALMQSSGFSADVISSMLLLLELEGYVESVAGGFYCRTARAG
jgi:DNA processing protein